jgi:hypothetical protein
MSRVLLEFRIVRVWRAAWLEERAGRRARGGRGAAALDPLWDQLFPAEQARIVQLLVERVIVRHDGLEIRLRVEGIGSVVEDLRRREPQRTAA